MFILQKIICHQFENGAYGDFQLKELLSKWYYDENHIFPIEATLKHKQEVYMRRKNAVYFFQISLFVSEIF